MNQKFAPVDVRSSGGKLVGEVAAGNCYGNQTLFKTVATLPPATEAPMPVLTVPLVFLDFTAQFIGAVTLVTIAAALAGYIIYKLWPKSQNPSLFAVLIPLFGLALAAYYGSPAAATAIVAFIILAVLGAMTGLA
jgi:hypothetical protein